MYHHIVDNWHFFELTHDEATDLAASAVENGARVTWSLDTIDFEWDDPSFGWGLAYDQSEGLYFLYMHDDSQDWLSYMVEWLDKQCASAAA